MKDPKVDIYIRKAADFAQPILAHIRELIHQSCPEVKEVIKWGMPCFDYMGPMISIAGFKQHCVCNFWKAELLNDPRQYLGKRKSEGGAAMGNLGRITSVKDLPPDKVMIDFIKQHMLLNENGIKPEKKVTVKKELPIPQDLEAILEKNKKAKKVFEGFYSLS